MQPEFESCKNERNYLPRLKADVTTWLGYRLRVLELTGLNRFPALGVVINDRLTMSASCLRRACCYVCCDTFWPTASWTVSSLEPQCWSSWCNVPRLSLLFWSPRTRHVPAPAQAVTWRKCPRTVILIRQNSVQLNHIWNDKRVLQHYLPERNKIQYNLRPRHACSYSKQLISKTAKLDDRNYILQMYGCLLTYVYS